MRIRKAQALENIKPIRKESKIKSPKTKLFSQTLVRQHKLDLYPTNLNYKQDVNNLNLFLKTNNIDFVLLILAQLFWKNKVHFISDKNIEDILEMMIANKKSIRDGFVLSKFVRLLTKLCIEKKIYLDLLNGLLKLNFHSDYNGLILLMDKVILDMSEKQVEYSDIKKKLGGLINSIDNFDARKIMDALFNMNISSTNKEIIMELIIQNNLLDIEYIIDNGIMFNNLNNSQLLCVLRLCIKHDIQQDRIIKLINQFINIDKIGDEEQLVYNYFKLLELKQTFNLESDLFYQIFIKVLDMKLNIEYYQRLMHLLLIYKQEELVLNLFHYFNKHGKKMDVISITRILNIAISKKEIRILQYIQKYILNHYEMDFKLLTSLIHSFKIIHKYLPIVHLFNQVHSQANLINLSAFLDAFSRHPIYSSYEARVLNLLEHQNQLLSLPVISVLSSKMVRRYQYDKVVSLLKYTNNNNISNYLISNVIKSIGRKRKSDELIDYWNTVNQFNLKPNFNNIIIAISMLNRATYLPISQKDINFNWEEYLEQFFKFNFYMHQYHLNTILFNYSNILICLNGIQLNQQQMDQLNLFINRFQVIQRTLD